MQPALSTRIQDGFMAAMRLGGEKPHQGLPGSNPALYQGPTVCNSTTALGLRGQAELNRVGSCSTGKERDTESGNDYFKYRYYASSMGRWMSPDPSGLTHANLGNPQSLNLYNYVGNNPLTRTDLDGLCWKGFSWACSAGQVISNGLTGYGWHTDATVERNVHNAFQYLHQHGFKTEGMSGAVALLSYQTYKKLGLEGTVYSGRTSGTGTPEENVQLRDRNHHMSEKGFGEAQLDKSSTNPDAIRGREQQLIEANGGAKSQGGTSGNSINGISDSNPNREQYMSAAEEEFGPVEEAGTGVAEGAAEETGAGVVDGLVDGAVDILSSFIPW
jgi:RHS repeat-associated protein